MNTKEFSLVTVFSTHNAALIPAVRSILDDAEIEYLVRGELLWRARGAVEFQVRPEDEHRARELLRKITNT